MWYSPWRSPLSAMFTALYSITEPAMPFSCVNSRSASCASVYAVDARKLCVSPSVWPTSCIVVDLSLDWMNASASGPSSVISPRASSSDIAKASCSIASVA